MIKNGFVEVVDEEDKLSLKGAGAVATFGASSLISSFFASSFLTSTFFFSSFLSFS